MLKHGLNIIKNFLVYTRLINSDERNAQIRDEYNETVSASYKNFMEIYKDIHLNHQSIAESVAKEASEARLEIKIQAQANNTPLEKAFLYIRDLCKSASSLFSSKSHKNSEEVAYSAFKTGGGDLGLENNGFGDVLKAWRIINKDTDLVIKNGIYPEAMSSEEALTFNECYEIGNSAEECIGESGITGLYEL